MPRQQVGIVFAGVNNVQLRELRLPELRPDEILVRSLVAGVSVGSDGWFINGRYDDMANRYPLIFGYQRVGIVEEVGSAVSSPKAGDRVFLGGGTTRLDPADGLGTVGGAYTRYGLAAAASALAVPDNVPSDVAALGGLIAVPMVGRNLTGIATGDLVVVLGQGFVGQMAAQLARLRGARVIAADLHPRRVALSSRFSADLAVPADQLREVVLRESGGCGADIVIDCTGRAELFDTWLELVRGACGTSDRPGKICLQGYYPDPLTINFWRAHQRRLTLLFPCGFDEAGVAEGLRLLAERRLTVEPLISHRFAATDAPEAFRLMLDRPSDVLAIVLDWEA